MKRIIKRTGAVFLILSILILSCGFSAKYNTKSYDTDKILNTIRELTSKDYNGRMAGTPDGTKTEEYVAEKFKEIGLIPGGTNKTYFQEFAGISGNAAGNYILEVLDDIRVIKSYEYAKDYKFVTNLSHSGEVIASGVELNSFSESIPKSQGGIAFLKSLNIQSINPDIKPLTDIYNAGYRGVIVIRSNAGSRIKGQMGNFDNSAVSNMARVCVTDQVYNELVGYSDKGYKIHIKSAFEVKKFTARNVIGVLKSKTPTDKCLIISAHTDHLAPDPDGVYFPGALDNASGTACIIEIARALSSQGINPDVNIVFAAFSGEEEMLYGSSFYARNPIYPLLNTRVINLDMVGAKATMPISILVSGAGKRGVNETDIIEEFKNAATDYKSTFQVLKDDGSDHSPFAYSGVPAVTLIDFEKLIYHVPEDTIDNIGLDNLKRVMDLTMVVIGVEIFKGESKSVSIFVYIGGALAIIGASGVIIVLVRKRRKAA